MGELNLETLRISAAGIMPSDPKAAPRIDPSSFDFFVGVHAPQPVLLDITPEPVSIDKAPGPVAAAEVDDHPRLKRRRQFAEVEGRTKSLETSPFLGATNPVRRPDRSE